MTPLTELTSLSPNGKEKKKAHTSVIVLQDMLEVLTF